MFFLQLDNTLFIIFQARTIDFLLGEHLSKSLPPSLLADAPDVLYFLRQFLKFSGSTKAVLRIEHHRSFRFLQVDLGVLRTLLRNIYVDQRLVTDCSS